MLIPKKISLKSVDHTLTKSDFIIEKQLPHWFMKYINCLSYPPPLLCNSIINPFLNSRISFNHDKVKILSANAMV